MDNRKEIKETYKYISTYMNINEQNGVVSTAIDKSQIRIVLTLGTYPRDLDSHLISEVKDNFFHIYYYMKTFHLENKLICMLDLDDTSSFGLETTTLYSSLVGTYKFYVYNFSGESDLSSSQACVRLYMGGKTHPSNTFNVPNAVGKY